MKLDSYWTASAPAFVPRAAELPVQCDVAIVGGGFTGLSAALALVGRIVRDEAIDCDFARRGKLKLATRPAHLEALSRSADRLVADGVDTDVQILHAPRVQAEVASDRVVGGLLYKRSAQMHMGRFRP